MPSIWKKAKAGRITRLVADLQQSPKHGGSLVVETGFPTSLIDLFVKNRYRLKKPSKRSHPPPPPPPSSASFSPDLAGKPDPQEPETNNTNKSNDTSVGAPVEEIIKGEAVGSDERCDGRKLLGTVSKVFLVVVLALSTKRLAVAITASAFVLILLEYAAAHVLHFISPCPDSSVGLSSLVPMFSRKPKLIAQENKNCPEIVEIFEESDVSVSDCEAFYSPVGEIRSVGLEPKFREKNWECLHTGVKKMVIEKEGEGEVKTIRDMLRKSERSKSAKLKAKIVKKIVPKKIRSMRKKKKEKKKNNNKEQESGSEASSYIVDKIEEEMSERSEDWCPQLEEESFKGEEVDLVEKNKKKKKKNSYWKCGDMIVLLLLVLVGLMGGKFLAILITIGWCVVLRFARGLSNQKQ